MPISPLACLLTLTVAPASIAGPLSFELELAFTGFDDPVGVTYAPDDDTRLFVFGNKGHVWVIKDGVVLAEPFLDISADVVSNGERGFLGLAFDPEYQTNGLFYINYTDVNTSDITLEKIHRLDADRADPSTRDIIHVNEFIGGSHNGGWLGFGPFDGMLYITVGDGELVTPPPTRAQELDTRFGKVLRIDVDGDDFPADDQRDYAIPADNPFVGVPGAMEEIWAYGLRNPWRADFDMVTGDLILGDVGRRDREEIDRIPDGVGGMNFGWPCFEGFLCTVFSGCSCADTSLFPPLHDYERGDAGAVIGGHVYRGSAIPEIDGNYFFADFITGQIWMASFNGDRTAIDNVQDITDQVTPEGNVIRFPTSFGKDADGEIYLCERTTDSVYKFVPTKTTLCVGDCNTDGAVDFSDLVAMLSDFATPGTSPGCDADASGAVDFGDLVTALGVFGPCP